MLKLNHKRLNVWKDSIDLIEMIYELVVEFPPSDLYGITSPLRRAAVSVSSNIAEGSSRKSKAERKRFYEIARSSLVEIDTQLIIAVRLNFVNEDALVEIDKAINKLFAMTTQLIAKT